MKEILKSTIRILIFLKRRIKKMLNLIMTLFFHQSILIRFLEYILGMINMSGMGTLEMDFNSIMVGMSPIMVLPGMPILMKVGMSLSDQFHSRWSSKGNSKSVSSLLISWIL
jgi:hypothetical protein